MAVCQGVAGQSGHVQDPETRDGGQYWNVCAGQSFQVVQYSGGIHGRRQAKGVYGRNSGTAVSEAHGAGGRGHSGVKSSKDSGGEQCS